MTIFGENWQIRLKKCFEEIFDHFFRLRIRSIFCVIDFSIFFEIFHFRILILTDKIIFAIGSVSFFRFFVIFE